MPRPLLRLAQVLLVLAAFCLVNGPDFLAQGVAWSTMIIDYSASDTVASAVAKTFDGEHPCRLCKQVDEHQRSPQKRAVESSLRKLHLCCVPGEVFELGAPIPAEFPCIDARDVRLSVQPPVPPPRVV
jgi:hypothetical protein